MKMNTPIKHSVILAIIAHLFVFASFISSMDYTKREAPGRAVILSSLLEAETEPSPESICETCYKSINKDYIMSCCCACTTAGCLYSFVICPYESATCTLGSIVIFIGVVFGTLGADNHQKKCMHGR